MPYQEAISLLLLERDPGSDDEVAFASSWRDFTKAMERVERHEEESSLSLKEHCGRLLSFASGLDPLDFFAVLDGALYADGLWPIKLRNSEQQLAEKILNGGADSLVYALLQTPLYDSAYVASLRTLSKEEVCEFLRTYVLSMDEVDAVFLKGSFASGNYRLDSDIDIGLVFSEGHSEEEKIAAVNIIRGASLETLNRMMDIKEYLRDENGSLIASDGIMEEVTS